jgi:RNA polymerase sigma factor (sigma-70 family)
VSQISYACVANCCRCYISEASLNRSYSAGPESAVDLPAEELLRIRAVLRKLTAARVPNAEDAEDLVQDTLLTMTIKRPEGGLRKGFLVWSMGILRKKVGNYYKKSQRYVAVNHEKEIAWQSERLIRQSFSPDEGIEHAELYALIRRIMAGFPPSEQVPMNLLLAGVPPHEIADELWPERYQNVINRIYRGRKKLAKALRRHGY